MRSRSPRTSVPSWNRRCPDFDRMRGREGQKLSDDILTRADTIERLVTLVEERSPRPWRNTGLVWRLK